MLTACCSDMGSELFKSLPSSTNAVESHNRCSKSATVDSLKVVLLETYKLDMAASLEHLSNSQGIKTSCIDKSKPTKQGHGRELGMRRRTEQFLAWNHSSGSSTTAITITALRHQ